MTSVPFSEETAPTVVRDKNSSTKGFISISFSFTLSVALKFCFILYLHACDNFQIICRHCESFRRRTWQSRLPLTVIARSTSPEAIPKTASLRSELQDE